MSGRGWTFIHDAWSACFEGSRAGATVIRNRGRGRAFLNWAASMGSWWRRLLLGVCLDEPVPVRRLERMRRLGTWLVRRYHMRGRTSCRKAFVRRGLRISGMRSVRRGCSRRKFAWSRTWVSRTIRLPRRRLIISRSLPDCWISRVARVSRVSGISGISGVWPSVRWLSR